jgi:hypothetical protein
MSFGSSFVCHKEVHRCPGRKIRLLTIGQPDEYHESSGKRMDVLAVPNSGAGYVEAIEGATPERMSARGGPFLAVPHVASEKQYRRAKAAFG